MPPSKSVTVQLDRPRELRYSMRAVEAIEQETGENVFDQAFFASMSGTDFITVVWAGLLHEDRDVSRDVVLDHVELSDMDAILSKVQEALGVEPDDEEEQGDAPAGEGSPKA